MHQLQPAVGQWYLNRELGRKFEVVSIDEDEGTIELQDEEGALDELDNDVWPAVDLEATDPPEDLRSQFDNLPEPDEAGGDPLDPDVLNTAADRDDLLVISSSDDEDGGWDRGMEPPAPGADPYPNQEPRR